MNNTALIRAYKFGRLIRPWRIHVTDYFKIN